MKLSPQCYRILHFLEDNGTITAMEALNFLGIFRLASRISEMRKAGIGIERKMIDVTNKFGEKCSVAQYSLTERS